jgi:sucrose phosphorylase
LSGHVPRAVEPIETFDKGSIDYDVLAYLIQLYGSAQGQRLHQGLRQKALDAAASLKPAEIRDASEAVLICYGDSLQRSGDRPLQVLGEFAQKYLDGVVSGIHILPFFPSSSDDGFAVVDYRQVRSDLGDWTDIKDLSQHFDLMVDLVINHCSRENLWFTDYVTNQTPGKDYFHELTGLLDLTQVLRPRNSPLHTEIYTRRGVKKVWTTFSDDQVDLNFANPEVLLEFADILFFYARMGARYIRLDAIAYLWKRSGTTCMSLPETHMVVRILRGLIEVAELPLVLITETNVPHEENISYFGAGNEAHLVYQFSLAPLLLFSYLFNDARALVDWTRQLQPPPPGCSYFNFISSHDGIGLRPLEGLMPESDIQRLVDAVHMQGGLASMRSAENGEERAYELNIALFSAFQGLTDSIAAFIGAHQLMLAYQGVPGIYLNAMVGTLNDHREMESTGRTRSINRGHWNIDELAKALEHSQTHHAQVYSALADSLGLRSAQGAFGPDALQTFLNGGSDHLMFLRESTHQRILVVASFAEHSRSLPWPSELEPEPSIAIDLLTGRQSQPDQPILLDAFQVLWLDLAKGNHV